MIEFAEILLQVVKQENKRTASQLVDLQTDTSFEIKSLKRYIRSFANSRDGTTRNKMKFVKDGKFHTVPVKVGNTKKGGCGRLYVNNLTALL